MNNQQLQKQITKQLQKLEEIMKKLKTFSIEPNNSKQWNNTYYSDLASYLKESLNILETSPHIPGENENPDNLLILLTKWDDKKKDYCWN